ncbi:MAG: type 1 glutamine amidotransferase [Rhodobacteraceae bacterium]|nr:type 1 glutamine amidotransferase [Paracoccaceae bacterium]
MNVLIISNYPDTFLGQLGRALAEKNATVTRVDADAGVPVPQRAEGYDAIAVFGGAQNALDDANYPFLPDVCDLIRAFHDQGKPVLGICLGSQLIARAFGAENILDRPVEFGWQEVLPTDAGAQDPLIANLGAGAPLFHWHSDTFTLPVGAVHLASSQMTPHQAFRIGKTTYAIQFHFEVGQAEATIWSESLGHIIATFRPDWEAQRHDEAAKHGLRADSTGIAIARAWVDLIGT